MSWLEHLPRPVRAALETLGPGFVTGASDDDPSGVGTYAIAGATLGYGILWTALFTFPLMTAVQLICARIGLVTGKGLAQVLARHFPRWVVVAALVGVFVANSINAGADLGAIAAAIDLLLPAHHQLAPALMVVPIGLVILLVQIWGSFPTLERIFKWLALALLAYVLAAVFAHPDWRQVLWGTLVPQLALNASSISILVAVVGTTISPYLFFFQASEEVEENAQDGQLALKEAPEQADRMLRKARRDVTTGMFFSNVVAYFIIFATAATLHAAGNTHIRSATEAATALRPFAGDLDVVLFAVGLIGSGILAVPVLTASAAGTVCEAFDWPCGLAKKPAEAKRYYGLTALATLAGIALNFTGINPFDALFWTAVINGVLAPPLLVLVMLASNNREIMGAAVNGRWLNLLGWLATIAMGVAAIALFVTWGH